MLRWPGRGSDCGAVKKSRNYAEFYAKPRKMSKDDSYPKNKWSLSLFFWIEKDFGGGQGTAGIVER